METPRILIIGSTNTDMVAEVPVLPVAGQTVLGGAFRLTPGGKGANQAVAAARAGGAVTFISAVGDDAFGRESMKRLDGEGIDTQYMLTKAGVPSGVALIMVDAQGENMIAVAPGANGDLSPEDLCARRDAFCDMTAVLLQLEIPLESVTTAAGLAQEAGATVLLNPAPMPPGGLPDALLAYVDILTPNEGELRGMVPTASTLAEAAAEVLARGLRVLVVTQGRTGATVFTREGTFTLPAYQVASVDTVGAGDCFSACLCVALAEGHSLPDALRFAMAAAALSTTKYGAQASMPRRGEIADLLLPQQW